MEPYVITSACVGVLERACVEVCPVHCIYEYEDGRLVGKDADGAVVNSHDATDVVGMYGATMLYVHPDECTACDLCLEECPVGAIVPQDTLAPDLEEFRDINRLVFPHPSHRSREG